MIGASPSDISSTRRTLGGLTNSSPSGQSLVQFRDDWLPEVRNVLADVGYGYAFPSSGFNSSNDGMPLIRIRDISRSDTEAYFNGDFDPAYIVATGDYLVGMDGDFNLRKWRGPKALLNQRVMRINNWRVDVLPEFFAVPLQMILDYLHEGTSQTTVKHLSAKQVNGIRLPVPSIEEQERIVARVTDVESILDELELQLTVLRRERHALRAALFHEALTATALS
jgi:type I restriction enzyme S subunit